MNILNSILLSSKYYETYLLDYLHFTATCTLGTFIQTIMAHLESGLILSASYIDDSCNQL